MVIKRRATQASVLKSAPALAVGLPDATSIVEVFIALGFYSFEVFWILRG